MTNYSEDFKYFKNEYVESMEDMFAAVSDLYAEYWNDFFHFAQFENKNQSWDEAFKYTHSKYINALDVKNAKKIIELACGRGGFANILAENTKASVLGVDISQAQLSHARRFERKNLSFKRQDIMKIDQLGETFDRVVYMDAACYLPNKKLAIRRISKVVEPGGKFLLIEWCKQSGLNKIQEEMVLHPFMKYWAIPNLETPENYQKFLTDSGFKIIQVADLNDKVGRGWDFGYHNALKGLKELGYKDIPKFVWKGMKLGPKGINLIKEQFPAALYIKTAFDIGFLRYTYFLVEKV